MDARIDLTTNVFDLYLTVDELTFETTVNSRVTRITVRIIGPSPAIKFIRSMKGHRAIADVMSHNPGVSDNVVFDHRFFGRISRLTPQTEIDANLLKVFHYRIWQQTNNFYVLALLTQPVCV